MQHQLKYKQCNITGNTSIFQVIVGGGVLDHVLAHAIPQDNRKNGASDKSIARRCSRLFNQEIEEKGANQVGQDGIKDHDGSEFS